MSGLLQKSDCFIVFLNLEWCHGKTVASIQIRETTRMSLDYCLHSSWGKLGMESQSSAKDLGRKVWIWTRHSTVERSWIEVHSFLMKVTFINLKRNPFLLSIFLSSSCIRHSRHSVVQTELPKCVFDRLGDIDCLRLINKSQLWANSIQKQLGNAAWQVLWRWHAPGGQAASSMIRHSPTKTKKAGSRTGYRCLREPKTPISSPSSSKGWTRYSEMEVNQSSVHLHLRLKSESASSYCSIGVP